MADNGIGPGPPTLAESRQIASELKPLINRLERVVTDLERLAREEDCEEERNRRGS